MGVFHQPGGFTLIELMVVILLLGLFAGLTVPMLTGFGENGLDASARRLAGTVKYLYNEAALTGKNHRLLLNLDEGSFGAQRREANGEMEPVAGTGRRQRLKGNTRFRDLTVADRGTFSSGEIAIDIDKGGWLEETVIHLDEEGRVLTLRLMPFTGSTEIYQGYREFEAQQ